jgi:hypothetical protein
MLSNILLTSISASIPPTPNIATYTSATTTASSRCTPAGFHNASLSKRKPFAWSSLSSSSISLTPFSYTRDSQNVFVHIVGNDKLVIGANPSTFQILMDGNGSSTPYARDGTHVYFIGESDGAAGIYTYLLPDVDPSTFSGIFEGIDMEPMYSEDRLHVYFEAAIIKSADPDTFAVMDQIPHWYGAYYAKDIHNVYYGPHVIFGADPCTFLSFDNLQQAGSHTFDAEDVRNKYLEGSQLAGEAVNSKAK